MNLVPLPELREGLIPRVGLQIRRTPQDYADAASACATWKHPGVRIEISRADAHVLGRYRHFHGIVALHSLERDLHEQAVLRLYRHDAVQGSHKKRDHPCIKEIQVGRVQEKFREFVGGFDIMTAWDRTVCACLNRRFWQVRQQDRLLLVSNYLVFVFQHNLVYFRSYIV